MGSGEGDKGVGGGAKPYHSVKAWSSLDHLINSGRIFSGKKDDIITCGMMVSLERRVPNPNSEISTPSIRIRPLNASANRDSQKLVQKNISCHLLMRPLRT